MTRDDIDAVVDVFTPDGTYSAFGDTYALEDFPALVAAAPKGLFLTGTPVLELDGEAGTGRNRHCASSTRPTTRCASATTPTPTGGRHRAGAPDPGHDLPPTQRRPRAGRRTPDSTRSLGGRDGVAAGTVELDEFKAAVDVWLDAHAEELACTYEGIGTLDEQMAQLRKVMRLTYDAGFMRMGWPERVGGLGGSNLLRAYLGEVLTGARPRRAGDLLHARGAGADHDQLRP